MRVEAGPGGGISGIVAHELSREIPADYIKSRRVAEVAVIILLSPVILIMLILTALPVFVCFRGKILFTQERAGYKGRTFRIYKFLTMADIHENATASVHGCRKHITRLGEYLRSHRIDELPQVINVIRGEMSLVGPRPEMVSEYQLFCENIPEYGLRKLVPQGITGWAQINYPHTVTIEGNRKKLKYDIQYIENISLKMDLKILLRTILLVVKGDKSCNGR